MQISSHAAFKAKKLKEWGRPELYLCTPIKVDYTKNYYIVGFEPNATMNTAHHMLLYGCGKPGSSRPVWDCGEMSRRSLVNDPDEESFSPCGKGSHSQIIYAWARDAPKLALPDGVGFKVGLDSPIKYIILQVHYAHVDQFKGKSITASLTRYPETTFPRLSLHLFQAVRWDLSSCPQKQDTSLLRHGLQGVMYEDSRVISASI
uniref:peptidylglycine monooxygenase n=1 Tax=Phlebotomus papatasi TaxID=29031 RepID=A0A1B0DH92_PHLPP